MSSTIDSKNGSNKVALGGGQSICELGRDWVQEGGEGGGKAPFLGLEVQRIGIKEERREDLLARPEGSADFERLG